MDFSPADKIKYKELLLQTYKVFARFCADNEIRYFAAGGTMIGAIRHHGFIPWDDDIDVYMKRSDYDKFLSLKSKLNSTDYEIIDSSNDGYYCGMAKFSHRQSTIWEFQSIPFVLGAYIDVFVLDYENESREEVLKKRMDFVKKLDLFYICSNYHPFKVIRNLFFSGEVKRATWFLFQKCILRPCHSILGRMIQRQSNNYEGKWLVAYTGTSGKKDIFQTEWFDGSVLYPFEDTHIEVPKGYDSFLKAMFGDYMTYPPIEEQVSHHALFYYNLERRITDSEIKQLQIESNIQ